MLELHAFAHATLQALDLPTGPLTPADGWSSNVLLTPTHALRVSSGRFRDAYAHEQRVLDLLPASVPHASVVARGRWNEREWMVQERIAGVPLGRAWPSLDRAQRRDAIHQLGRAAQALHACALSADFTNPWLDAAIQPDGNPGNAYHAPPHAYTVLLDAAMQLPVADQGLVRDLDAFMRERTPLFDDDPQVLVHCDLHFANIMWSDGVIGAILDWEGSRRAARDQELDTLYRFLRTPSVYGSPDDQVPLNPDDLRDVPAWLAEVYPELLAHPRLPERLAVYEAMWQLVQVFNFAPGSGVYDPWRNLRRLLDSV